MIQPTSSNVELLTHLRELVEELVALHTERAESAAEEYKVRAEAFHTLDGTVSAKDTFARHASVPQTMSKLECEGKIAALTEEKFFILRLLDERRNAAS